MQKGHVALEFVSTNLQLVDRFTKPLDENKFYFFRRELGMPNSV